MKYPKQNMVPGSVVVLINAAGKRMDSLGLKVGDAGELVDGKKVFPALYRKMRQHYDDHDLNKVFVCVRWATALKPNGYFQKQRFLKIGDVGVRASEGQPN